MTLIDTSAWVEALRTNGDELIREKIRLLSETNEAALCEPVLLELYNGHQSTKDRQKVEDLREVYPVFRCTEKIWEKSFSFGQMLRKLGVTAPSVDVLIYSIAAHYHLKILAVDKHFALIEQKLKALS